VILIDLNMPVKDGFATVKELKEMEGKNGLNLS
jgi:CheY-like chemotaxis protein